MASRMIAYTVKQNESGLWSVSCMGATLADDLQLDHAIGQAREAACAEHLASGLPTRVDLHGTAASVPLAGYQKLQDHWTGATA
jgi:hypothetical protein